MSKIVVRKINNATVVPFKVKNTDDVPVMGADLFPELYCNIFIAAKRKSGKTTLVQNIIKRCCNPETTVVAFSGTIHSDPAWVAIKKFCDGHSIPFQGFTGMKEGKVDILADFVRKLKEHGEREELSDEESYTEKPAKGRGVRTGHSDSHGDPLPERDYFGLGESDPDDYSDGAYSDSGSDNGEDNFGTIPAPQKLFTSKYKSVKPKYRYKAPEYFFIFDDMSQELRRESVNAFLKSCRHYGVRACFVSQWVTDLQPASISNMDYILLFKGQPESKLKHLLDKGEMEVDLDTFIRLYRDATHEQYGFLYIDVKNSAFRKNFDQLYEITPSQAESGASHPRQESHTEPVKAKAKSTQPKTKPRPQAKSTQHKRNGKK